MLPPVGEHPDVRVPRRRPARARRRSSRCRPARPRPDGWSRPASELRKPVERLARASRSRRPRAAAARPGRSVTRRPYGRRAQARRPRRNCAGAPGARRQVNAAARSIAAAESAARPAGSASRPRSAPAIAAGRLGVCRQRPRRPPAAREPAGGQHRRAAGHRLEHRQAEALAEARVGDHAPRRRGSRQQLRAAGSRAQQLAAGGHLGDAPRRPASSQPRPPASTSAGGSARSPARPAPSRAMRLRHVLARLDRAEERDVRPAVRPRCARTAAPLGAVGHVEPSRGSTPWWATSILPVHRRR